MSRASLRLFPLLLGACGIPQAAWTAGLGFGAAALTFDDELLNAIEGRSGLTATGAADDARPP